MFNKDFKYMEGFFKYYDKLYDAASEPATSNMVMLQGYDYDIVDGKVVYDPKKFNKPMDNIIGVGKMSFTKNTPSVSRPGKPFYDLAHGAKPDNGVLMGADAGDQTMKDGFVISYENRDVLLPNAFNGPPTKTMQSNWAQLQTMEMETYTEDYLREDPVSSFDDFVKQWNDKGGAKITEEVNEWYSNASKVDVMSKMGLK